LPGPPAPPAIGAGLPLAAGLADPLSDFEAGAACGFGVGSGGLLPGAAQAAKPSKPMSESMHSLRKFDHSSDSRYGRGGPEATRHRMDAEPFVPL
jgi:hypothetical protein